MILLDTSGVLAAIDPRQAHHSAAAAVLRQDQRRVMSPFVLAELDYLLTTRTSALEATKLLCDVGRGVYDLAPFSSVDVEEALGIIEQHTDLALGLTDASIMVLADQLDCLDVLTLDQRHYRAVLSASGRPYRLLPFDA